MEVTTLIYFYNSDASQFSLIPLIFIYQNARVPRSPPELAVHREQAMLLGSELCLAHSRHQEMFVWITEWKRERIFLKPVFQPISRL